MAKVHKDIASLFIVTKSYEGRYVMGLKVSGFL